MFWYRWRYELGYEGCAKRIAILELPTNSLFLFRT